MLTHRIAVSGGRATRRRITLGAALLTFMPLLLTAQRRPGVGMGFYTTTGLVTADVEAGSVTSSSASALGPSFAISGVVTAPLRRQSKRAWIAGIRATPLSIGNRRRCVVDDAAGCRNRRFEELGALLTGGAFDVRATVLRVMAGAAVYNVKDDGARIGTTVRVDFSAPQLRGSSPTLFLSRTFLGSQRGEGVGLTTLGAGFRWVRKK